MTNVYHLPETDRLAADLNPFLDEVVEAGEEKAGAFASGALTIIALMGEAAVDLGERVRAAAIAEGSDPDKAVSDLSTILGGLQDAIQPRINAVRNASYVAKGYDEETIAFMSLLSDLAA